MPYVSVAKPYTLYLMENKERFGNENYSKTQIKDWNSIFSVTLKLPKIFEVATFIYKSHLFSLGS